EVARRRAARDLEIDEALLDAVAARDLGEHGLQRGIAHRCGDLDLAERAMEPPQMKLFIDEPAGANGDDLVAPIGELIAAILDMDRGGAVREIAAVDIGD